MFLDGGALVASHPKRNHVPTSMLIFQLPVLIAQASSEAEYGQSDT